jgi:hypothetical protein
MDTDADGVDHLWVDYRPYVHEDRSLFGWSRDFVVRRSDVERWERLHPELAAPPLPPPPPPPQTTAGAETRAIAHLKPLLKLRRDAMSKDEAWKECEQFSISRNGFENHVWPTARAQAGLERKAPAGRKKGKPADISEIEQAIGPAPGKKSRRKSRS